MSKNREVNGRFKKGHTIGKKNRFKLGNILAAKYDSKYCSEMIAYFTDESIAFHTFEEFAHKIGVISDTLRNWCEENARFRDAYALCKEISKNELLLGGLTEKFNPQIVKFLAINNHGMKEKIEHENNNTGHIEVKIDVVD